MKDEKVVGYVLLTVGVAMIFVSVYLMFNVFTGVRSPPVLVHFSDISIQVPSPEQTEPIPIVSGEALNGIVAIGLWYTFMFFIMFAGGRVGSLGVSLIKEVRVEVKEAVPVKVGEEAHPEGEEEANPEGEEEAEETRPLIQ